MYIVCILVLYMYVFHSKIDQKQHVLRTLHLHFPLKKNLRGLDDAR